MVSVTFSGKCCWELMQKCDTSPIIPSTAKQNIQFGSRGASKKLRARQEMKPKRMFISPNLMGRVSLCMSQTQHNALRCIRAHT